MMRLDANRAFNESEACRFAAGLDPSGIELFEQPCDSENWEANAKVASDLCFFKRREEDSLRKAGGEARLIL